MSYCGIDGDDKVQLLDQRSGISKIVEIGSPVRHTISQLGKLLRRLAFLKRYEFRIGLYD